MPNRKSPREAAKERQAFIDRMRKWRSRSDGLEVQYGDADAQCGNCGEDLLLAQNNRWYCPACGAQDHSRPARRVLVKAAFPRPYDGWTKIRPGTLDIPTPLEDRPQLWRNLAKRIGVDPDSGIWQQAFVIGGRRRYHHRPGWSFILPDKKKVLTLTTDELEAKTWNRLKRNRHVAFPRIYEVIALKTAGSKKARLFAIVHEKINWPPPPDWELFIDSFFRWRAMRKNALSPARQSDLKDFLAWVYDPETTDPVTTKRGRVEHVLPWQMTKDRRKKVKDVRDQLKRLPDLEGMVAWAKSALRFLKQNSVKFRDLDPSNLGKTLKGRTVITNIAESRSIPKKIGRLGSLKGSVEPSSCVDHTDKSLLTAAVSLADLYRDHPGALVRSLLGLSATVSAADGSEASPALGSVSDQRAQQAIDTLRKLARHIERDAAGLEDEEASGPSRPEVAASLLSLAQSLERTYKKIATKMVQIR